MIDAISDANSDSIFISYASPDQARVIPFFEFLCESGFNAWIDCKSLKPGQNWGFEIKRELDNATFVLAFVSKNSFDRRGYVQRELKVALDRLTEKLVDDIYIIPILLDDDVAIPDQLRGIQCIKASDLKCNDRIVDSINHQLARLGRERSETQKMGGIVWGKKQIHEEWDGTPGYRLCQCDMRHLPS